MLFSVMDLRCSGDRRGWIRKKACSWEREDRMDGVIGGRVVKSVVVDLSADVWTEELALLMESFVVWSVVVAAASIFTPAASFVVELSASFPESAILPLSDFVCFSVTSSNTKQR